MSDGGGPMAGPIQGAAIDVVPSRRRWVVAGILIALFVIGAGLLIWYLLGLNDDDNSGSDPVAVGGAPSEDLEQFYTQSVEWSDCGTARCARIDVPINYEEPDGETLELSIKRYQAKGDAIGSIVVNPGGPGGSSVDFAGSAVTQFSDEVLERYDVVGVDPRGVGESTGLRCLDGPNMDQFVNGDPDPDTPEEVASLRAETVEMGEACLENSGDIAAHVSTEEAARDLDIVRAVLGREKLDWYGASYGTQLGATYANLFPDKVGRMVLDGAVDPSLDSFDSALGQATGFQRAFDAYAADCVPDANCPLGSSVDEARTTITDFMAKLDSDPLPASSMGGRELTLGTAFYGIALPLYSEDFWDTLTTALSMALNEGDGTILLTLSDAYFERDANGEYNNNNGQTIYAIGCLDADQYPTLDEVEARLDDFAAASPVFGEALGWGVLACTDWPIKATSPQAEVSAEGAPPIVVVGTTRDPATPYEWAEALADQLDSGVLLSREGDGHTAFAAGNSCIDDAIESFFVDGTVPEDGTMCPEE